MQLDIPAFNLQVSPLGRGENVLLGAGVEVACGAGYRHFPVGRRGGFTALALQADLAAGGVEVDAGLGAGFVFAGGFADGEERNAIFDGQAVVALGDEVGVLPGGDAEVLAGGEDVVLRGELGDAGGGAVLEARFGPGGDGAGAALGGFDIAAAGFTGALGCGGAQDVDGVFEGCGDRELVGLWIAFEGGVLFGGDFGQAVREA